MNSPAVGKVIVTGHVDPAAKAPDPDIVELAVTSCMSVDDVPKYILVITVFPVP